MLFRSIREKEVYWLREKMSEIYTKIYTSQAMEEGGSGNHLRGSVKFKGSVVDGEGVSCGAGWLEC